MCHCGGIHILTASTQSVPQIQLKYQFIQLTWPFFLALDFLNCIHEETDLKYTQANE